MDGTEVIAGLRGWTDVPILVLSGRTDSVDKVDALDAGADDYVTKPFGMDELLARLRAMTRRSGRQGRAARSCSFGETTVDLAARRVTRDGADVRLTPTEWHLLEVLVRHPGKLLSQRQLLTEVWGPGYETAQGNLRVYMAQLRRKLEPDPARPRHLLTEPGMGYRFEPDPRPRAPPSAKEGIRMTDSSGRDPPAAQWRTPARVGAVVLPLATCAILSTLRDDITAATAVLILVLWVVAAAASGDRVAGVLAALSGGVWFDFFLTEPYQRFTIADPDDIEATVLLVLIGVGRHRDRAVGPPSAGPRSPALRLPRGSARRRQDRVRGRYARVHP